MKTQYDLDLWDRSSHTHSITQPCWLGRKRLVSKSGETLIATGGALLEDPLGLYYYLDRQISTSSTRKDSPAPPQNIACTDTTLCQAMLPSSVPGQGGSAPHQDCCRWSSVPHLPRAVSLCVQK